MIDNMILGFVWELGNWAYIYMTIIIGWINQWWGKLFSDQPCFIPVLFMFGQYVLFYTCFFGQMEEYHS